MKFPYETGMALILVMGMLSVLSLLSLHVLHQSLLLAKNASLIQNQLQASELIETELLHQEKCLLGVSNVNSKAKANKLKDCSEVSKNLENFRTNFIPDHLEFGCKEGVTMVSVLVPPFQTHVVIRER